MSLFYKNSHVYHLFMAMTYRHHWAERFRAVAEWVPDGAEVLDVCCGDGSLVNHLPPTVSYRGLDRSSVFIRNAQKRGRTVEWFDVCSERLPKAEIVICQVSLYQFYPLLEQTLERRFDAATQRLIVSESVWSLTRSKIPLVPPLIAWAMRTNDLSDGYFRFTPEELDRLFAAYQPYLQYQGSICGGLDRLFVLDKASR
ncbi:MAG: methionine biosynthesis protein MetW [Candidatus Methylumidiphilus sp.]